MESKHKQAATYAEQNANIIISKAIEEVYKAGYEAGCKDCRESSVIYDYQESVEFIDLGLTSGTLWANDYLRDERGNIIYFSREEADNYDLPTLKQWEEVLRNTVKEIKHNKQEVERALFFGRRPSIISFYPSGYYYGNEFYMVNKPFFWLKEKAKVTDGNGYNGREGDAMSIEEGSAFHDMESYNEDCRFPIRLVKTPTK